MLFATADIAELPMEKVFTAIIPLLVSFIVVVVLLNVFPPLTLWLPTQLGLL